MPQMDVKTQIKSLLKEADLYRSQGLLHESKTSYQKVQKLLHQVPEIRNQATLAEGIQKKIDAIDREYQVILDASQSSQVPEEVQDLIKEKFAFSHDDAGALEGAVALARFGQFDRAIKELGLLLQKKTVRVQAAKNIIRCHIANATLDTAAVTYRQWLSANLFTEEEIDSIRVFFESVLVKKGMDKSILKADPNTAGEPAAAPSAEEIEEEILDISSIGIKLDDGACRSQIVELDVSFQNGNVISLIVSSQDQDIVENLKVGVLLNDVQFYSPVAIFNGKGMVSAKTRIESGPKKGDYSIDIRISSR